MGILPSKLGLGCWSFGTDPYWGEQPHTDTIKTLHAALRAGITHFDTAQIYAGGRSEQVTGQQLKRVRDKVVIATKSLYRPPGAFQKALDTSLRRLCTDYIDIFYLHWPSGGRDFRPIMDVLEKNRKEGKIRWIGVSNFSLQEILPLLESGTIDFYQLGYSLLWRRGERDIIPFCRSRGIGIVTYSSLAQGVLTNSFLASGGFGTRDPRRNLVFLADPFRRSLFSFLRELQKLAEQAGCTMAQLALAWVMAQPWVSSVLTGARNRRQIEETAGALSIHVESEILEKITSLSDPLLEAWGESADTIFSHTPRREKEGIDADTKR